MDDYLRIICHFCPVLLLEVQITVLLLIRLVNMKSVWIFLKDFTSQIMF